MHQDTGSNGKLPRGTLVCLQGHCQPGADFLGRIDRFIHNSLLLLVFGRMAMSKMLGILRNQNTNYDIYFMRNYI